MGVCICIYILKNIYSPSITESLLYRLLKMFFLAKENTAHVNVTTIIKDSKFFPSKIISNSFPYVHIIDNDTINTTLLYKHCGCLYSRTIQCSLKLKFTYRNHLFSNFYMCVRL